jgi:hypothetical protein
MHGVHDVNGVAEPHGGAADDRRRLNREVIGHAQPHRTPVEKTSCSAEAKHAPQPRSSIFFATLLTNDRRKPNIEGRSGGHSVLEVEVEGGSSSSSEFERSDFNFN